MSDYGYWAGSFSYQPSWAQVPFEISLGSGPDANGVSWLWMAMTSWDSPATSGQVVQRASDHGGWATSQYYAPATPTLTIVATAPSQAARDVARSQLQQIIPVNDLALMTYDEPVPKQMLVRRSGQITETASTLTEVQFQCVLVAPDPRKYSATLRTLKANMSVTDGYGLSVPFTVPGVLPEQSPPGAVSATNNGTFETRPLITVSGPITSPAVTNLNARETISFTGLNLANSTDVLQLDTLNQVATVNGALYNPDITSAWFVCNPGPNEIQLGGTSSGGATLSVAMRDAYI